MLYNKEKLRKNKKKTVRWKTIHCHIWLDCLKFNCNNYNKTKEKDSFSITIMTSL